MPVASFLDVEVIATVLTKQIHPEADLHFRVGVQNSQLALSRRFQHVSSNMCLPGIAVNAVAVQVSFKVHVSLAKAPHTNMSQTSCI